MTLGIQKWSFLKCLCCRHPSQHVIRKVRTLSRATGSAKTHKKRNFPSPPNPEAIVEMLLDDIHLCRTRFFQKTKYRVHTTRGFGGETMVAHNFSSCARLPNSGGSDVMMLLDSRLQQQPA